MSTVTNVEKNYKRSTKVMGKIMYEYERGNTSYVTTFEVSNEQNAFDVAESLNKLIAILGLRNELATVKIDKNQNSWYPSTFGKLHSHPRMEQDCKLQENHVIVDRTDWEEAKQKLSKYERDEILRGPEPMNRMCMRQETFEKLVAILEFYGNEKLYRIIATTKDNFEIPKRFVIQENVDIKLSPALENDKGEAAKKILNEITNKK